MFRYVGSDQEKVHFKYKLSYTLSYKLSYKLSQLSKIMFWCAGSDQEEVHYKYQLTVIHGKSEYSYKGPVISLMRSANEVRV